MKLKKTTSVLLLLLMTFTVMAQNFTDSNLPIVVIETDGGVNIPDEPKVLGTMKIIWHQDGSRNYMSDIDNPELLNYDGRIGIERRGSSSQTMLNKKPYALETREDDDITNRNVSILGMPEENDWVLNSLAFDQTGMRDVLAYELSNRLGQYASRSVYCEVVINGDYKGLYAIMEKIKPDKNRVNIEEMDETCNNYPEDWWNINGDLFEFIEITNNGDEEVDLTGMYFRELGVTYTFPEHAHIEGHQAVILCSDSLMFTEFYNTTPFGQYTRKLSNKSENLVLADAWGNVIDQVCYSDSLPWPMEADGEGPYLELKDLDSDNSLPENWTTGDDLTGIKGHAGSPLVSLYPNPTHGEVHIMKVDVAKVQVYNTMGQLVKTFGEGNDINLSGLPEGLYFLLVTDKSGDTVVAKITRK